MTSDETPQQDPDVEPDDRELDEDDVLGALAEQYAAQLADTTRHPVATTSIERVRDVLSDAFTTSLVSLTESSGGSEPEVQTSEGQVDLPPPDPREPSAGGVEVSSTRRAVAPAGEVVLHETTARRDVPSGAGDEIRRTVALTGSGPEGERFWLGATSYAGAPVDHVELLGDLTTWAAPVLGQVLTALRQPPPG